MLLRAARVCDTIAYKLTYINITLTYITLRLLTNFVTYITNLPQHNGLRGTIRRKSASVVWLQTDGALNTAHIAQYVSADARYSARVELGHLYIESTRNLFQS